MSKQCDGETIYRAADRIDGHEVILRRATAWAVARLCKRCGDRVSAEDTRCAGCGYEATAGLFYQKVSYRRVQWLGKRVWYAPWKRIVLREAIESKVIHGV